MLLSSPLHIFLKIHSTTKFLLFDIIILKIYNHVVFLILTVYTEITNVVCKSNIWRHGRSYSVSVPSYVLKAQKGRRRVPKEERKVMVESFVNKYIVLLPHHLSS